MSTQQIALAPEISTWPDENPQLIGSTCGNCGATTFRVQQRCPKCSAGEMSDVLLPRRGTLVAWTTQGFPPGLPYKVRRVRTSSRSASALCNSTT